MRSNRYPSLQCLMGSITQSSCQLSDFQCIAQDKPLNAQIETCVKRDCTIREALTTKNFTETAFGVPQRDDSKLVSYTSLIAGGIALLAVILRVFARLPCWGGAWGLDDWFMMVTMIPMVPLTVLSVVLAEQGLGKDMWTVPFDNITNILHVYYFDELFYIATIALTKISILFFYLRIFPHREFRLCTYATMAACFAYMLAFLPGVAFQCVPIRIAWEKWDDEHHGKCINMNALALAASALNMILDAIVVALPLRELAKLEMSRRRKAGILFMFLGGGFVTVVSMLRIKWMAQFANTQNVTWDYTPVGYWSTLEVHVGVLIACLPALRALQHRLFPASKKSTSYYDSPRAGYGHGSKGAGGSSSFPMSSSLKAKFSRSTKPGDEKDKSFITSTSQASMMRSSRPDHYDTKNFIPLEEYDESGRATSYPSSKDEELGIGTGGRRNSAQLERGSTKSGSSGGRNATFGDSYSKTGLQPGFASTSPPPTGTGTPFDGGMGAIAVHVKKEYSVNVERC
ncbi:uncharacterized protein EI97DRAFT_127804 [Westerdykella ornata]|uniref:Uncharacterized protein n=1 Tax=Westerdykella ornata TaxID=318751 RepID=A0A6A6JDT2_WESOR|nr:uncharacterized protein EI97DRAFT_127804 [Westerdykella ornata]KAF2274394.1 hypothetical protein EI97DRAFT_127804 [Westerdykella ornata]